MTLNHLNPDFKSSVIAAQRDLDIISQQTYYSQSDLFKPETAPTAHDLLTRSLLDAGFKLDAFKYVDHVAEERAAEQKDEDKYHESLIIAQEQKTQKQQTEAFQKEHHSWLSAAVKHFDKAYDEKGLIEAEKFLGEIKGAAFTSQQGYSVGNKILLSKQNGLSCGPLGECAAATARVANEEMTRHGDKLSPNNAQPALDRVNAQIQDFIAKHPDDPFTKEHRDFKPLTLEKFNGRSAEEINELADWMESNSGKYKTRAELKVAGIREFIIIGEQHGHEADPELVKKLEKAQEDVARMMAIAPLGIINPETLQKISAIMAVNVPAVSKASPPAVITPVDDHTISAVDLSAANLSYRERSGSLTPSLPTSPAVDDHTINALDLSAANLPPRERSGSLTPLLPSTPPSDLQPFVTKRDSETFVILPSNYTKQQADQLMAKLQVEAKEAGSTNFSIKIIQPTDDNLLIQATKNAEAGKNTKDPSQALPEQKNAQVSVPPSQVLAYAAANKAASPAMA